MLVTGLDFHKTTGGGEFAFLPNGYAIRDIAGAWMLFDADDVVVASYPTKADAVKAVTA